MCCATKVEVHMLLVCITGGWFQSLESTISMGCHATRSQNLLDATLMPKSSYAVVQVTLLFPHMYRLE